MICPYSAELPDEVIEAALRTHAACVDDAAASAVNDRYEAPEAAARALDARDGACSPPLGLATVAQFRDALWACGAEHEFALADVHRLVAAASEVLASLAARGGVVETLGCWAEDDRLVCELAGAGGPFDDPLLGYAPPDRATGAGIDLWLARQLVDALTPHTTGGCASLRFVVERSAPHA